MIREGYRWRAYNNTLYDFIDLLLVSELNGKRAVALPHKFLFTIQEDSYVAEPTLKLDRTAAQSLMDSLYSVGLRPTDAKPQGETIKAMSYHLEDMRSLVFKNKE